MRIGMRIGMGFVRAAAIIAFSAACLAGPASAQSADGHVPRYGEKDPEKTQQQKEADKAAERAYQRSLGNVPEKGPVDPWGTARSLNEPKSQIKAESKGAAKSAAKSAPKTAAAAAAKPAAKPAAKLGDSN